VICRLLIFSSANLNAQTDILILLMVLCRCASLPRSAIHVHSYCIPDVSIMYYSISKQKNLSFWRKVMNEQVLRIEGIRQCRLSTNLRIFMVKNKTIKRRAVYEIPMKKCKLTFVCIQQYPINYESVWQ
jgi:hypothetical protein